MVGGFIIFFFEKESAEFRVITRNYRVEFLRGMFTTPTSKSKAIVTDFNAADNERSRTAARRLFLLRVLN